MEKDLYTRFDECEAACVRAQSGVENARNAVGRRIAKFLLAYHSSRMSEIMAEADTTDFLRINEARMSDGLTPIERSAR